MKRSPHRRGVPAAALLAAAVTCAALAGGSVASAAPRTAPASHKTRPASHKTTAASAWTGLAGAAARRGGHVAAAPAGLVPGAGYSVRRVSRHGVTIGFAGAEHAGAVRPARVRYTLTVHGINMAGKPDSGDTVAVENVNDPAPLSKLGATLARFHHGAATFHVPAGTYWAVGIFSRVAIIGVGYPGGSQAAASGNATRLVVLPQFTVSANGTLTVDERTATSKLTVTAPRPTRPGVPLIAFERISPGGKRLSVLATPVGVSPMYVSPTSKAPTDGTLYSFAYEQLLSPAAATATYQYYVALRGPRGLVPAQHFRISAASLATIHENLYSGARGNGSFAMFGGYAAQGGSGAILPKLAVPGRTTMYVSAGRSIDWNGQYTQVYPFSAGQYESPVAYRPGQVATGNWNAYPLHPAPNVIVPGSPTGQGQTLMSADRSGNTLTLDFMPFTDSVYGHLGSGYLPARGGTLGGTYRIQQDGKTIAAGNALKSLGIPSGEFYHQVQLTSKPSVVTFTLTAKRTGKLYPLSPASSTTWTWHSTHEAGTTVPPAWICSASLNRDCRAEPLLTLAYAVNGLGLDGRTAAGAQLLTVRVGHLQLAAAPKITKVTVQVSVNGGKTWSPATVTGSGGTYQARFTAHAGSLITLRTTATGAAGGQISETITSAYAIAS